MVSELRKIYVLLLSMLLASGCDFDNRAIRGGEVVEGYNITASDLPIEEIYYRDRDGTMLYAWFIKKKNHHRIPTIIFLHGSRGNISNYLPVIKNLYQTVEANLFVCDFPGTGASRGTMSLANSCQMTLAAIDYLATDQGIRPDRIVLYGTSMGASLAFYGASKRKDVLVIVDSGVTSASDYMKKFTLIPLPDFLIELCGENFNNYPLVNSMKNPKLFLHGKEDRFIDIRDSQRLYEQASEPKDCLWLNGGHVLFGDRDISTELGGKIGAFLAAHLRQ